MRQRFAHIICIGFLFAWLTLTVACTSLQNTWQQWSKSDPGTFQAIDGHYFPAMIHRTFANAREYEAKTSTLRQAQAGLQILGMIPLNHNPHNHFSESNLAWSKNGAFFSYEQLDQRQRLIHVRSLDKHFHRQLNTLPRETKRFLDGMVADSIVSYNSGLSWSHDSRKFAYMSNAGTGIYNIHLGSLDDDDIHVLTQSPNKDGYAAWSPKQDELAFVSSRSGAGDIYVFNLSDESLARLTHSDDTDLFPDWSPEGLQLIFSSGHSKQRHLKKVTKAATGWQSEESLTHWFGNDLRPKVSPCGQWVAFYSSQSIPGQSDVVWNLHIIHSQQRYGPEDWSKTILVRDVVVDLNTGPAWSPDASKIFYVKRDQSSLNPIEVYDLIRGKRQRLKTGTQMNRDLIMSSLGVLSFRAQVGAWDRVFLALTNQGGQLQKIPNQGKGLAFVQTATGVLHQDGRWFANQSENPSYQASQRHLSRKGAR